MSNPHYFASVAIWTIIIVAVGLSSLEDLRWQKYLKNLNLWSMRGVQSKTWRGSVTCSTCEIQEKIDAIIFTHVEFIPSYLKPRSKVAVRAIDRDKWIIIIRPGLNYLLTISELQTGESVVSIRSKITPLDLFISLTDLGSGSIAGLPFLAICGLIGAVFGPLVDLSGYGSLIIKSLRLEEGNEVQFSKVGRKVIFNRIS